MSVLVSASPLVAANWYVGKSEWCTPPWTVEHYTISRGWQVVGMFATHAEAVAEAQEWARRAVRR